MLCCQAAFRKQENACTVLQVRITSLLLFLVWVILFQIIGDILYSLSKTETIKQISVYLLHVRHIYPSLFQHSYFYSTVWEQYRSREHRHRTQQMLQTSVCWFNAALSIHVLYLSKNKQLQFIRWFLRSHFDQNDIQTLLHKTDTLSWNFMKIFNYSNFHSTEMGQTT